MARYLYKKKTKLKRRFGPLSGQKPEIKRPFRPGMHGRKREGKQSEFGRGLFNKNKLRASYGISEKQLRNYIKEAMGKPDTAEALLQELECRLDNVVYRLGLAPTLPAARQMVVHGHVQVQKLRHHATHDPEAEVEADALEFERVDRPSYRIVKRQRVKLGPKLSKKLPPAVEQALKEREANPALEYVTFDRDSLTGYFNRIPGAGEIPVELEIAKVVEFSSRRL